MQAEDSLHVNITWDGQHVQAVRLDPRALVPISALLRGKPARDVVPLISMLFALCGQAQAAAAAVAVRAAEERMDPVISLWRERQVLTEALQEQLWRFLLDLPRVMQTPADPALLRTLRRRLMPAAFPSDEQTWQSEMTDIERCVGAALLGPLAEWHSLVDAEALLSAVSAADTPTSRLLAACLQTENPPFAAAALMPHVDRTQLMTHLAPALRDDPDFSARPHWRGSALETGPLARLQGRPALDALLAVRGPTPGVRLLARLLDIDALFSRLRAPEVPLDSWVQGANDGVGTGLAWVQTARGLLLHRVVLDNAGMIEDYCIVAPTEWNFHPDGACALGLRRLRIDSAAELRRHAELLVHALDPCVSYQIELSHA